MSSLESNTTDTEDMRYKHHLIMCVFNSIIFECCHGVPLKIQKREPISLKVVKRGSGSTSITRPASQTEGSWSHMGVAGMEYGLQHKIRHRRSKRRAERTLFMVFTSMQASMLCSICRQKRNRRCVRRHCTRASTSRS